MIKTTQKELRELAARHTDCTNATREDHAAIIAKEGWLEPISYAAGIYGCNGVALRGHNTGELYVTHKRSTALFIFN